MNTNGAYRFVEYWGYYPPTIGTRFRNVFISSDFIIQSDTTRNVLAKVPLDQPYGEYVFYKNPNNFRSKILLDELLTNVTLKFTDDDGKDIDFRGAPWDCTIQIDFLKPDAEPMLMNTADALLNPDMQPPDDGKPPDKLLYGQ
jgi:hypothetical protein